MQTKYIVLELQTNADGGVGTLVTAFDDWNQAESKYHTVLASAAISSLPCHAAVLLTHDGCMLSNKSYEHAQPEPEPEPEAE